MARVLESAPEICLVLAQAPVGVGFAERMRREHVLTGYWFVENWRHMDYWSEIAPAYDYFFHIQPGDFEERLDEVGCRFHAHIPTGCDPGIHRPVVLSEQERDEFTCAVSFAGAGYPNRNRLLSGLTDYDLRIWGVNWTVRELAPFVRRPDETYTPEFFAKIVAGSAVNLNLHSSAAHPGVDPDADAVNPRVFEIASCGGFQVCDPCQGLDRLFEFGSELPVYRDLSELRALLDHYLPRESERRAIADRARARALAEHTYTHRLSAMLERIVDAHGDRLFAKGIRTQHTVGEMLERIDRDSSLAAYLATLPPDIPFTQDAIAERLGASDPSARCEAEDILAFLRSMRATTEALLDGREYRPK